MKRRMVFLFLLLAVATLAAHAQGGCVNSPENPTALLLLVGGLSAGISARRRRSKDTGTAASDL